MRSIRSLFTIQILIFQNLHTTKINKISGLKPYFMSFYRTHYSGKKNVHSELLKNCPVLFPGIFQNPYKYWTFQPLVKINPALFINPTEAG